MFNSLKFYFYNAILLCTHELVECNEKRVNLEIFKFALINTVCFHLFYSILHIE